MDIVERLRAVSQGYVVLLNDHGVYTEAADEIERLREQCEFEKKCRNDAFEELKQRDADIERLRDALEDIAKEQSVKSAIIAADLFQRIARAALKEVK